MTRLYKYSPNHRPEPEKKSNKLEPSLILQNCTFKVSPVSYESRGKKIKSFNDPFELRVKMPEDIYDDLVFLERLVRKHEPFEYFLKTHNRYKNKSLEERKRAYKKYIRRRLEILKRKKDFFLNIAESSFSDTVDELFRIFCASSDPESVLMWSHYADEHRGIVVAFDLDYEPFSRSHYYNGEIVEYKDTFPIYDMRKISFGEDPYLYLLKIVSRKSEVWSYEKERRFLIPKGVTQCITPSLDVVEFEPNCIRHVYLGSEMDDSLKQKYLKTLKQEKFKHVGITQMKPSQSKYSGFDTTIIRKELN